MGEEEQEKAPEEMVKHHLGKYMGHGDEELGRTRTGHPDAVVEPETNRTAQFVEEQRPHFTTSMDQRNFEDAEQDPETEGMALKEDAAPGADAQGG